jgi:CBS domain-containing protein
MCGRPTGRTVRGMEMDRTSVTTAAAGEPASTSYRDALVRDAMRPEVLSCSADAPLRAVAQTMAREHVHCVVVRDAPDQGRQDRWAIVSDDTLLGNAGEDFGRRTAGWVAVADYPTIKPTETVERAVDLMISQHVRHLVVVDEVERRPIGVLSTLDVARVLARDPS